MSALRTSSLCGILPLLFAELIPAASLSPIGIPDGRIVFTDATTASGITFKHHFAPEKRYIIESMSGGSYVSQNYTRLHFGLERRTKADAIEVRWPNGAVERLTKIPANTFISIREGEGSWTEDKKR